MRKIISLFLAITMIIAMVGCSDKDNIPKNNDSENRTDISDIKTNDKTNSNTTNMNSVGKTNNSSNLSGDGDAVDTSDMTKSLKEIAEEELYGMGDGSVATQEASETKKNRLSEVLNNNGLTEANFIKEYTKGNDIIRVYETENIVYHFIFSDVKVITYTMQKDTFYSKIKPRVYQKDGDWYKEYVNGNIEKYEDKNNYPVETETSVKLLDDLTVVVPDSWSGKYYVKHDTEKYKGSDMWVLTSGINDFVYWYNDFNFRIIDTLAIVYVVDEQQLIDEYGSDYLNNMGLRAEKAGTYGDKIIVIHWPDIPDLFENTKMTDELLRLFNDSLGNISVKIG